MLKYKQIWHGIKPIRWLNKFNLTETAYLLGGAPLYFHHLPPQRFTLEIIKDILSIIKHFFELPKPDG